ncbi:SDR family NAD(P)-dependent oxidoreductase [bacterium]|nr:MAG: SDR family NAD(P)-dependent oxidoreductase [bacterium]
MKLKDKVAGVTGSARGLGWEMVQAFAQEGAKVVICDLEQTLVDQAVSRLNLSADRILGVRANVSIEEDVLRMFQKIQEKFGRLDVWVNNAGFSWPPKRQGVLEVADTPLEVWFEVLNTNLTGTFLCGREALKMMRAQRLGHQHLLQPRKRGKGQDGCLLRIQVRCRGVNASHVFGERLLQHQGQHA